jgi:hypothetical protein
MLYKQTFTVEGCFNFPLDMLRYDRCTPYEQIDVDRVEASVRHDRNLRTIKLVRFITNKKNQPTIDRWASFGWNVHPWSIETEKM